MSEVDRGDRRWWASLSCNLGPVQAGQAQLLGVVGTIMGLVNTNNTTIEITTGCQSAPWLRSSLRM